MANVFEAPSSTTTRPAGSMLPPEVAVAVMACTFGAGLSDSLKVARMLALARTFWSS